MEALLGDAPGVRSAVPGLGPPVGAWVLRGQASARRRLRHRPARILRGLYGASEVVALDLSVAVDAARENLRGFENVEIVQGDLLRPPFRTASAGGGFDLIYSIGVLRISGSVQRASSRCFGTCVQRNDRSLGLRLREQRPGPKHDGAASPRFDEGPPSAIARRWRGRSLSASCRRERECTGLFERHRRPMQLPLSEYMSSVANFSFRQNYAIVFDQLAAPTATVHHRPGASGWFSANGLEDVESHPSARELLARSWADADRLGLEA